tara:strand:- start:92 stop:694 length:603 start_codon:yes stop_codon:yes gene_type:complete
MKNITVKNNFQKIKLGTTALLKPFEYHKVMKDTLMDKIEKSYNDNLNVKDDYYGDVVHRLDWSKNLDYDREWVKYVKPGLQEHFEICANDLNYKGCKIKGMWYQQYVKNNTHGWHIHGENYTGVYYLELPDDTPKTELIDQYDINKKITIDANEGDIVIFPSFIIHRAPKVLNDSRKTIISFNLEFDIINEKIFDIIDNL